ncbi:MAG: hypothetical protein IPP17_17675 [Bacteroidetes bacterium]|nr:hypothetical protein [Bacteroidota bacterium]
MYGWVALAANTTITQNAAQSLTFSNISTANTAINMQSTGDFVVQDNGVSALTVQDNGNVSIGTTNQMQIDNTGDFVRINNVPTNFPAAQGIAGQVLTNNGTGDLTWTNDAASIGASLGTETLRQAPISSEPPTTYPWNLGATKSLALSVKSQNRMPSLVTLQAFQSRVVTATPVSGKMRLAATRQEEAIQR